MAEREPAPRGATRTSQNRPHPSPSHPRRVDPGATWGTISAPNQRHDATDADEPHGEPLEVPSEVPAVQLVQHAMARRACGPGRHRGRDGGGGPADGRRRRRSPGRRPGEPAGARRRPGGDHRRTRRVDEWATVAGRSPGSRWPSDPPGGRPDSEPDEQPDAEQHQRRPDAHQDRGFFWPARTAAAPGLTHISRSPAARSHHHAVDRCCSTPGVLEPSKPFLGPEGGDQGAGCELAADGHQAVLR